MIKTSGFKRFSMPSDRRYVPQDSVAVWGDGSFDGWTGRGRNQYIQSEIIGRGDRPWGGHTRNPSKEAFYRINRWVKR